jgi:hypothetical protein
MYVFRAAAIALRSLTVAAGFRPKDSRVAIVDEGVDVPVRDRIDAAPPSPIAAIRAALRNEFLAPKVDNAVATVASVHLNAGFIDELHESGGMVRREGIERRNEKGPIDGQGPGLRVTGLRGYDAHGRFARRTARAEYDRAGDLCEKGVVSTKAHVDAWMNPSAALSDQNASSADQLAAISLYTQPLRLGVATIAGTPSCLLMCHRSAPTFRQSNWDRATASDQCDRRGVAGDYAFTAGTTH